MRFSHSFSYDVTGQPGREGRTGRTGELFDLRAGSFRQRRLIELPTLGALGQLAVPLCPGTGYAIRVLIVRCWVDQATGLPGTGYPSGRRYPVSWLFAYTHRLMRVRLMKGGTIFRSLRCPMQQLWSWRVVFSYLPRCTAAPP